MVAIRKSEAAVETQTVAVLRAASDGAEAQLIEFLDDLKQRLLQVASDPRIGNALTSDAPFAAAEHSQMLRTLIPADVQELFLLGERGNFVASSVPKIELSDSPNAEYFLRGSESFFAGDVFQDPATQAKRIS